MTYDEMKACMKRIDDLRQALQDIEGSLTKLAHPNCFIEIGISQTQYLTVFGVFGDPDGEELAKAIKNKLLELKVAHERQIEFIEKTGMASVDQVLAPKEAV